MAKEEFCGLCTVVPLALTGAGLTFTSTKEQYRNQRTIMLIIGFIMFIGSVVMYMVYNNCSTCLR